MNGAFIAMQSMMQASSTSMRNAMKANQNAYSMAYTEMTNIYANCQTVNPMGAKMCASCKNKVFLLLADAAEEAQKSFSELGNALREVNT